ncbi:hypothetical protein [Clostridium sp.]
MEGKCNNKFLKNSRNGASNFILEVIVNDDGGVRGKIQHCESSETKYFKSLIEMILLINGKFDQLEFPQPTNQIRSWKRRSSLLAIKGGRGL